MENAFDIQEVLEFLPHRYPILLIDRILEIDPGKSIKALKNVTINEPYFQGHFPENPIMPGVMIVEAMGQAGGVLVLDTFPPERRGSPVYFLGFDGVRFRRPVAPGDQLIIDIKIIRQRQTTVKMTAEATVDGELATEGQLLAMIGEKS